MLVGVDATAYDTLNNPTRWQMIGTADVTSERALQSWFLIIVTLSEQTPGAK